MILICKKFWRIIKVTLRFLKFLNKKQVRGFDPMFSFFPPVTNEANKCLKTSLTSPSQGLRWHVSCEKILYSSPFTYSLSPDKKTKLYWLAKKGNENQNNADWGVHGSWEGSHTSLPLAGDVRCRRTDAMNMNWFHPLLASSST